MSDIEGILLDTDTVVVVSLINDIDRVRCAGRIGIGYRTHEPVYEFFKERIVLRTKSQVISTCDFRILLLTTRQNEPTQIRWTSSLLGL